MANWKPPSLRYGDFNGFTAAKSRRVEAPLKGFPVEICPTFGQTIQERKGLFIIEIREPLIGTNGPPLLAGQAKWLEGWRQAA